MKEQKPFQIPRWGHGKKLVKELWLPHSVEMHSVIIGGGLTEHTCMCIRLITITYGSTAYTNWAKVQKNIYESYDKSHIIVLSGVFRGFSW